MRGWQLRFLGSAFFAISYLGLFHRPQVRPRPCHHPRPRHHPRPDSINLCHPLILVALQLKVDKSGRTQILILSYSRSFSQVLSISFLGGWSDLLEQRQILHSFLLNGVWSFCSGVFSLQRSGSSLLGTLMAASTVSYFYEPLYKPFASHHNCEVNIQIYDHSVHSPRWMFKKMTCTDPNSSFPRRGWTSWRDHQWPPSMSGRGCQRHG